MGRTYEGGDCGHACGFQVMVLVVVGGLWRWCDGVVGVSAVMELGMSEW